MGGGEGLESGRWLAASRADARDGERGSDAHTGKDFRVRVLVMSPRAKAGAVRPDCKAISGDGRSIRWRRFTL